MTATDPAEGDASRSPLVDRLSDAACAIFAVFTVCAHGVGLLAGNLFQLSGLAAGMLAIGAALLLRRRSRRSAEPVAAGPPEREISTWLRLSVVAAGGGLLAATSGGGAVALWWGALAFLVLGTAMALQPAHATAGEARPGRGQTVALLLLACGGAVLSLICHRYAIDDSFYVSVATAAADHPARALLSWDPLHGDGNLPLHNPIHRVHSFELLQGALSLLTGVSAIRCFHFFAAAVGGLLVPICLARPLRQLMPTAWLPALVAALTFLVANGDTNTSYGNYAFTRMWQGKAFLLYVWLPLVTAHALRFAARPTAANWAWLGAAQIAAVGASSTAIWLAPLTAGVALVANAPWRPRPGAALRSVGLGVLASFYPLLVGVSVRSSIRAVASIDKVAQPLGEALAEAIALVVGGPRFAAVGLAALLLTWALVPAGTGRRYAAVAPLIVWALLLDPFTESFTRSNITGPSFWRALWALPIPLLVGMAVASPLTWKLPGPARLAAAGAGAGALLLLFAWVPIRTTVASGPGSPPFVNRIEIAWPGLKVDRDSYAAAGRLVAALPADALVIAPERVARWVPTFHRAPRPLLVRALYLKVQRRNLEPGEYQRRVRATQYVSGETTQPEAAAAFRRALREHGVAGVCLAAAAPEAARRLLTQRGFSRIEADRHFEIWTRRELAPGTPTPGSRSSSG